MRKLMLGVALLGGAACGQAPTAIRVGTTTTPEGSTTSTSTEPAPSTTVEPTTTTTEPEPVTTTVPYVAPVTTRRTTTTVEYEPPSPQSNMDYGEWAIPAYIVMCESGGRWNAYNPSGASGPYQMMPMHFGGELAMNQSRAAQHAMAAKLWAGGAGRSHWAACL